MTTSELEQSIAEQFKSAKDGGQFTVTVEIPSSMKVGISRQYAKHNVLIIDLPGNKLMLCWIGSKSWYKSTTGKSSYNRDLVMQAAIPKIIKQSEMTSAVKFLNPVYVMQLTEMEQDGNTTYECKNILQAINKLFPIVSKFK